ncbi:hypothetical protein GGF43_004889 [Coemansia sp. RSA 2618]|nr:hypothetical protein GGF43_004889 [Coemansia sp. RSA 2618]
MFLALRQSPGHTASRSDLVRTAVELDARISRERGLPRAFTGKTPMNSASALLTNNGDRHFEQFRPEGAKCYHFRLAYRPGDFESALKAYEEWMEVLVEKDWPVCFGEEAGGLEPKAGAGEDARVGLGEAIEVGQVSRIGSGEEVVVGSGSGEAVGLVEETGVGSGSGDETRVISGEETRVGSVEENRVAEETKVGSVLDIQAPTQCTEIANNSKPDVQTADTPPTAPDLDIPKSWHDVVTVQPSTIPNAGNGLFAKRDLPGGIPLGFYFGVPMTEDEFDSLKEPVGLASHYSIMYRKTVLDATDERGMPYTDPDGRLYCPFHFMNEARVLDGMGGRCNIAFLEGAKVNQIICLTSRAIRRGEELFVSYGDEVDRSHWDERC